MIFLRYHCTPGSRWFFCLSTHRIIYNDEYVIVNTLIFFSDISALLVALPYGMQMQVINTRLLTSGPSGLLDFVFYAFRALKPCDQRDAASSMHVSGTQEPVLEVRILYESPTWLIRCLPLLSLIHI